MSGGQFTCGAEKRCNTVQANTQCGVWQTSPSPGRSSAGTLGRHLSAPFLEPLTLFSTDWFLCVASKMVMNCRYWGLVQRPMPGREGIGNSVRKARKQDEQVSGRELKIGQEKVLEEVRRKGTKGLGSGEMGDLSSFLHIQQLATTFFPAPASSVRFFIAFLPSSTMFILSSLKTLSYNLTICPADIGFFFFSLPPSSNTYCYLFSVYSPCFLAS